MPGPCTLHRMGGKLCQGKRVPLNSEPDLSDDLCGIGIACPAPLGELHGVDAAFAMLDLEDDRMRDFELRPEISLRERRVGTQPQQDGAEFFVLRFVLRPCTHNRYKVESPVLAPSIGT